MTNVLLVYATTHGHTAKIAGRLAEALRPHGVEVDLRDVRQAGDADPERYAAVIVGASLHAGHHQRRMVDWVKAHRATLADRASAFLSVSLIAAEDGDEARAATQRAIEDFEQETGWTPATSIAMAGALQYREYDVFTRLLMRLKMRQGGHTTDTSQDHEYTDWAAVERFAAEFVSQSVSRPR